MKKAFLLLCIMVFVVSASGCGTDESISQTAVYTEDAILGKGAKTITVKIVDEKSEEINLTINTDAENLGAALKENNLVSGTDGPYGLYIKTVNGVLADYDKNGAFWSFLKNGEQLMTGADGEKIENGNAYEIIYTK